ncbi:MAG: iron-containing alcohol dehydrogenase, partial [Deltaproteobacteria bacterium]|nr:iron-containing alcohol dehydrogenase [Deltaproteobacteria bacterium]
NLEAAERKYAEVAEHLGVRKSSMDEAEAARAAIAAVKRLREELCHACGLPFRLRDAGVSEQVLEAIAEGAVNDGTSFYNPREVVKEELLKQVKKAY